MKHVYKLGTTLVTVFSLTLLFHVAVHAQDTPATGCEAAQQYLKAAQKPRDVRTRVDRLQSYRYIHQRLDTFTRRVERNNQPNAKNLRANIDRLHDVTEAFRLDYEAYDEAREAVVAVKDCRRNSEEFSSRLETARSARAVVAQDVALLRSIIATNITEQLQITQQQLKNEAKR